MTEMMMLDLERINLDQLCAALEDHSADQYDAVWLFDRRTGKAEFYCRDAGNFDELDDLEGLGEELLPVEPLPSSEIYGDMADFADQVPQQRPAELLTRAIEGRGAFRRFKDTLLEFPELRQQWFALHDARMRRRALEWLADHGVIDGETADRAQAQHPDPPIGGASATLAQRVADDLRALYGDRLVQVVFYGSRARGDHHEDSDLDLLVVLDRVDDWSAERDLMDEVIWKHSYESGVLVSAQPVSADEYAKAGTAFLRNVKTEGVAA